MVWIAYYIYRVSKDGGTTWGAWSGKLTEPTTLKLDGAANCKLDIIAYDNAGNKSDNSGSSNGGSIDDKLIQGLYRVNTDVITAVSVINNSAEDILGCPVTFTVGGVTSQTTSIGIPAGSSNLVWFKWHTPSIPGNVAISATAGGGASASVDCYDNYIYPCDEKTPPNPLSTDRAPNGFTFMSPTASDGSSSTSWGQWTYTIKTEVVTDKDGKPVKDKDGKDTMKNTTIWNYMSYSASLSAKLTVSPDGHCPTANSNGGQWNMKSGYGINEHVVTTVSTTSPGDVTPVQRVAGFYPEFGYGSYDRLFDRMSGGIFELAKNKYSMYQSRVHFMPVWWYDRSDYTPQVYAFDAWTPGGPLSTYLTDSVKIQGSVFEDWHSGPIWSTR